MNQSELLMFGQKGIKNYFFFQQHSCGTVFPLRCACPLLLEVLRRIFQIVLALLVAIIYFMLGIIQRQFFILA